MTQPAVFMRAPTAKATLRLAHADDLAALNGVIERAIMTWQLPERVKRLSLPSYRYHTHDLDHLHLVVAEDADHAVIGVAAWTPAHPRDLRTGEHGLLLHGLYVDPAYQRRGVGARLLDAVETAAQAQGLDGVLAKAQADAVAFFEASGWQRLPIEDPKRDYPHRFWRIARSKTWPAVAGH
jgi:GNAT superfamily N-acetyltransferase